MKIDDYRGAYQAVSHLIEQGYQRIAHLTGDRSLLIYADRYNGYVDALKDGGFTVADELVIEGSMQYDHGKHAVESLKQRGIVFDAVFSSSDYAALGAVHTATELGIRIPDELGVVGFANESFDQYVSPSLTSVDQRSEEMGQQTAAHILHLLKEDYSETIFEDYLLTPNLIVRKSSKRN